MQQVSSLAAAAAAAPKQQFVQVLCCQCGIPIAPNTVNTCAACLASTADITKGISTEATLHQCRGCQRWHKEAGKWIACELESRELMALCLNHVSGLRKNTRQVRLVDASWIWTEPHSMRLKVRLTIQRQVQQGTILQQSFTVMFIVRNQQCVDCQSVFRQGSWKSLVQVRQRVSHKRTFLYLEQLILKQGAHRGCLKIETFQDGMDFYFPDKGKAARFIAFLESVCPTKSKSSKKLISTDDKSNVANFKYTNLVEICPLCKDDLLYLPSKLARNLGNISRLVLVKGISNLIHFIDPLSGQTASMTPEAYWRSEQDLRPLLTAARARLTRYVALGKEPIVLRQNVSKRKTNRKQKSRLARVTLAREDDLGVNDVQVEEQSHVGYLLKAGDVCLAYDLKETTQFVNDDAEEARTAGKLPEVVVLRKLYGGSSDSSSKRFWKLQRLNAQEQEVSGRKAAKNAQEADAMDEEDFMQEVEADREMRMNMNLYKNKEVKKKDEEEDEEEDEDDQKIQLDELLEGLALEDGPDDGAQDDSTMMQTTTTAEEGDMAARHGLGYVNREQARTVRDKESAVAVSTLGPSFLQDDEDDI